MARGFVWATYVDDLDDEFALQVDADYVIDPSRGWQPVTAVDLNGLPRGWRARRVYGLDLEGHVRTAICATTTCDLWTGQVSAFYIEATDQTQVRVEVVGRQQERRTVPVLNEF